jgi:hypothetical protein
MTGFLNDLMLSATPEDPNNLPEGKYPAFVSKLEIKDILAKPDKPASKALIITYKISHLDVENINKEKSEFKSLPKVPVVLPNGEPNPEADADDKKNASFLKLRLLSLGVPEDQLDHMSQEDLLGTPVWITIVQSGTYKNIRNVELREEEAGPTGQL